MNYPADLASLGIGLLVARVVIGLLMAAHGTQKLFGWFGGYGLKVTGEFFAQLGFPAGHTFAMLAAVTEVASGLLVALGLFGPVGPALMISVMIVAAITVHWEHGLFAQNNGIELPLLYGTAALAIALTGYGIYSLDAALGLQSLFTPRVTLTILALGIVGGFANVALRRIGGRAHAHSHN